MAQAVLRIGPLPADALDAAQVFYAEWVPKARLSLQSEALSLALVINSGEFQGEGWIHSAIQELARAFSVKRVNALIGGDDAAIAATLAYLERAPGVTGQCFQLGSAPVEEGAG
ncbi:Rossmann fold domain-containing protein [Tsuneonella suprasediminis]|uniref:Rossmann fold domain-containing protein n=1 Tax=Tsuneonella suprasediminis TaxID=2306996 RepID=UPI002F941BFF